jgi:DNA-directed RNA polymerase subunit beta'
MQYQFQPKRGFSSITIKISSPDDILNRSHGEVTKPETINYRSFRPEKDGLFCEKIFGPIRDWECACGKYKRIRYKGIVCDRCGVEVTQKSVRRERMGHIMLAVPVVHIWFLRSLPSKISGVIGLPTKDIERIVYYESYVVIQPGSTGLQPKDLLTEDQYLEVLANLRPEERNMDDDDPKKFIALIGGEAIKELLHRVDPDESYYDLRELLRSEESLSQAKKADVLKRLRILDAFRTNETKEPNKPEWMVLDIIPVIPPDLRPLVPLEGGRFATSDLNDLYRRVIIRNNRLKRLIDIKAPEVILRNEKRMLQESVDALFDNSRRAVRSESQRALKSLADTLKGKTGRFRQNLLGKRVDYSGRSVIVVGPELKIHECGLPKDMAVELFKPLIIRKLIERGHCKTVKSAKKQVEKKTTEVWDILDTVIDGHPVLLNRAPTLHRLGIQAFQPKLIEGKAIQLHPLVTTAFNADFDGDQMAVHVPLSHEAQLEALLLILSAHNIMHTQNGEPIAVPSQDMVLGTYYLTKTRPGARGDGKLFASAQEVIIAYNSKKIDLHARVKVRVEKEIIETSVGRVLFNQIVPKAMGYLNELLTKKRLRQLIGLCFRQAGLARTVEFLDKLKEMGFITATAGGLSVSIADVVVPADKDDIIARAQKEVDKIEEYYHSGVITEGERYNKIIDTWSNVTNKVADKLYSELQSHKQGFNTFYMMMDSQARGSKEQIRQLAGMRGLMAKPQKAGQSAAELIENPIISNFKEGLTILEYFISTHGARKGLADTALKTADAGYLTRRLHDVAQDVVVSDDDCGTIRGVDMRALKDGEEVKEPLYERILGRTSLLDVSDPITGEKLVAAGQIITEEVAEAIEKSAVEMITIRSVLTCESRRGVCAKCYGRNMATGQLVDTGEAVGTIASQSIGEPGTQLTLRTFHTGGTASLSLSQSQIHAKFDGIIQFENMRLVAYQGDESEVNVVVSRSAVINIVEPESNRVLTKYDAVYGAELAVTEGQHVKKGDAIFEWDPYNSTIITEKSGRVRYRDLVLNLTYKEAADEQTGHTARLVIDSRDRTKSPAIEIVDDEGKVLQSYIIPTRAQIVVEDNEVVNVGSKLVKMPRDLGRLRDITGGLPRVTELFEARSPQNPAAVTEIDGIISIEKPKRGSRVISVTSEDGSLKRDYSVPIGKHVLVQEGDLVRSGQPLTEGAINPHDILHVKGTNEVQAYLVNEIQEVYRMQGVKINDKHIEVIVRQMLQKVRVTDAGDSQFLEGDQVDRLRFTDENDYLKSCAVVTDKGDSKLKVGQLIEKKKLKELNAELKKKEKDIAKSRNAEPAVAEPLLLGITQASLTTESWLSAASFQETTRVLADASAAAKADRLQGLKENIILGQLIPAGTGLRQYQDMLVSSAIGNIFGVNAIMPEAAVEEAPVEEKKPARKKANT